MLAMLGGQDILSFGHKLINKFMVYVFSNGFMTSFRQCLTSLTVVTKLRKHCSSSSSISPELVITRSTNVSISPLNCITSSSLGLAFTATSHKHSIILVSGLMQYQNNQVVNYSRILLCKVLSQI